MGDGAEVWKMPKEMSIIIDTALADKRRILEDQHEFHDYLG